MKHRPKQNQALYAPKHGSSRFSIPYTNDPVVGDSLVSLFDDLTWMVLSELERDEQEPQARQRKIS